jgi:flagellar basal-body rod protein FlgB
MSWLDSPLLERFLDVTSMRQTLVSTNLANVDTPGYHTRDVNFRWELALAASGADTRFTSPLVIPVRGLTARPDGNDVSVDREALLLSEVQLEYKTATTILHAKFAELSTAIKEGQP